MEKASTVVMFVAAACFRVAFASPESMPCGQFVLGGASEGSNEVSPRTESLEASAWGSSEWISVRDAPVAKGIQTSHGKSRAADGTSWFVMKSVNDNDVISARWMVTGLGVFDVFVNGRRVGTDFLKPGFTHNAKTKYAFTYDVTKLMKTDKGEKNVFAAEVSAGWWRDKIVTPSGVDGFVGKKSAFRGVLEVVYSDGTKRLFGTNCSDWRCGIAGPVTHAAIFDGEEYDARRDSPFFGDGLENIPEPNKEFNGDVLATAGAEICLRQDLALMPVDAYCWKGIEGADVAADRVCAFGKVVKTRTFDPKGPFRMDPGETLVVDFGQNCAAVPCFRFKAKPGTVMTVLPGEMLNEANGECSRGNDGPAGSVYRKNLRCPEVGMRIVYTFAGTGVETYMPRFTYFGYRYVSITATDDVEVESVTSIPVTSIRREMETGRLKVGDAALNRFVQNVYWGQLSNYLNVPTDCPQRNERLGWAADAQVFVEAGSFNADTQAFFRKWMKDMRDSQGANGGFPSVAPFAQYGNDLMRIGWGDAGIIIPYRIWKQFGDTRIIAENWGSMEKFLDRVEETRYAHEKIAKECGNYQWADWLSFEKLESAGGSGRPQNWAFEQNADGNGRHPKADALLYWDFLGGCYWVWDARLMAEMAKALNKDPSRYERMVQEATGYVKERFFKTPDSMVTPELRGMQTPALFALKFGFVESASKDGTIAELRKSIGDNGGCLQTGFLGTSILMDVLTENGMIDVAYDLLLNHEFPSWLYSVDQGATTVWERWNSYTKSDGFCQHGMNSFNHYAYGAVLAWVYKHVAGIATDPSAPGFHRVVMAPRPDRRLGFVKAEYRSAAGLIKSEWHYEGRKWIWDFEIPEGVVASVTFPGSNHEIEYYAGTYHLELTDPDLREGADHRCVKVIFDTDMYTDFDDVGALACLHALADAGECDILATICNTRDCMSVAMCEIINAYYGRPEIPVGCVRGRGVGNVNNKSHERLFGNTVEKYAKWVKHRNSSDAPDATAVYRNVLSAQPDNSVVICSVGYLTNLGKLMETDYELVKRKVRLWVAMACCYPEGRECNSMTDWQSSKIAFEKWPTPIVFSDFQYGRDCFAGRAVAESGMQDNPIADVFCGNLPTRENISGDLTGNFRRYYGMAGRAAWDETAVLIAVRGADRYCNVHRGTFRMTGDAGTNEWIPDEKDGAHLRVTEKVDKKEIGKIIDELMCRGHRR